MQATLSGFNLLVLFSLSAEPGQGGEMVALEGLRGRLQRAWGSSKWALGSPKQVLGSPHGVWGSIVVPMLFTSAAEALLSC